MSEPTHPVWMEAAHYVADCEAGRPAELDQARQRLERELLTPDGPTSPARQPMADVLTECEGLEEEAQRRRLMDWAGLEGLRPLSDYLGQPEPPPVIWRDDGTDGDDGRVDAILSAGEVALLAGEGGAGKSTLALHLAAVGNPDRAVGGLRRADGPAVLVSYEDSPQRLAGRLAWIDGGPDAADGVHVLPDPAPLWEADPDERGASKPGRAWAPLWAQAERLSARLVVVDPVSAALADVSTSETGPVRAFLGALSAQARRRGAGVLLVAHPTKAGRRETAGGRDPGPEAVAGSAAWWDGARGVLTLERGHDGARLVVAAKANYGASGWAVELAERSEPYRGLKTVGPVARDDVADWRKQQGKAGHGTLSPEAEPYEPV